MKVWSIYTRIFHFLLVLFIGLEFINSEYLKFHISIAIGIAILMIYRIIWGFIGEKYARFKYWSLNINKAKEYLQNFLTHHTPYPGHNPAASIVLVFLITMIILSLISGFIGYYFNSHLIIEIHEEIITNILIVAIVMHIGGASIDFLFHKETNTLKSIITGEKNIDGEDLKLNIFQHIIAITLLSLSVIGPIYYFLNFS